MLTRRLQPRRRDHRPAEQVNQRHQIANPAKTPRIFGCMAAGLLPVRPKMFLGRVFHVIGRIWVMTTTIRGQIGAGRAGCICDGWRVKVGEGVCGQPVVTQPLSPMFGRAAKLRRSHGKVGDDIDGVGVQSCT